MKANDEVPALQGKIPMAFTARAAVAGEPSCHAGAKMAKIAPRAWESGECRVKTSVRQVGATSELVGKRLVDHREHSDRTHRADCSNRL